jgi:hypothetical protein
MAANTPRNGAGLHRQDPSVSEVDLGKAEQRGIDILNRVKPN